jgi:hypothetical protein
MKKPAPAYFTPDDGRLSTTRLVQDVVTVGERPIRIVTPDGEYLASFGQWEQDGDESWYAIFTSARLEVLS